MRALRNCKYYTYTTVVPRIIRFRFTSLFNMMATKRQGNTHSIWQWTISSFLLFLLLLIGTCDGFRRTLLCPAILKDSCTLRNRNHPSCPSTSTKFSFGLSYSTNSLDVLASSSSSSYTTDLIIPSSNYIPETTTVVVSDGFDPSGFFVTVLGSILNGPG